MSGGVTPAPTPTPAKMMPLARPRSADGIQAATTQLDAGYMTALPMPNVKRIAMRIGRTAVNEGYTHVINAVNTAHQRTAMDSVRRGPILSASQPPGVWKRAYPRTKALKTQPSWRFVRPKSLAMACPAMETLTRSTYAMALITNIQKMSSQRTLDWEGDGTQ